MESPAQALQEFGGPVPPSHARLDLFGAVDQLHMGVLRQQLFGMQGGLTNWHKGTVVFDAEMRSECRGTFT